MTLRRFLAAWAAAPLVLGACARTDAPAGITREQRGDTLVIVDASAGQWGEGARLVRGASFGSAEGSDTAVLGEIRGIAVGADGRVVATDGQRLAVRVFDTALQPVGLWGRDGAGPGELRSPDGGVAVLSDGRVVVRDPGNARAQVYAADGTPLDAWRVVDAGLRTRDNFGLQGDTLLSRVVVNATGPIDTWTYGLARIAPDGRVIDTVALPTPALPRQALVARNRGNTAEIPLPFAPTAMAAWHPAGGFAVARGDAYAITWPSGSGLLRVERLVEPTRVGDAESAQEREYVTKGMRWLDPAWTWTGPEIPPTKPILSQLFIGRDGSVWALREGEAVDRDDPDYKPNDASSVERRLRSALSFDVFAADGAFLGSVALPPEVQLRPQPSFDARGFVALELDAAGVPRLTRFTVEPVAR